MQIKSILSIRPVPYIVPQSNAVPLALRPLSSLIRHCFSESLQYKPDTSSFLCMLNDPFACQAGHNAILLLSRMCVCICTPCLIVARLDNDS